MPRSDPEGGQSPSKGAMPIAVLVSLAALVFLSLTLYLLPTSLPATEVLANSFAATPDYHPAHPAAPQDTSQEAETHDIAITAIGKLGRPTVPPFVADPAGSILTINVTVENKGTVTETFLVKLGESNAYMEVSSENDNTVREITETSMDFRSGSGSDCRFHLGHHRRHCRFSFCYRHRHRNRRHEHRQ